MNAPVIPRGRIVAAIVVKDVRSFKRDRFWLFMTVLAVAWFVALYYLLPDRVQETVRVGVHWTDSDAAFDAAFMQGIGGIEWVRYPTRADLEAALGIPEEQAADTRSRWQRVVDTLHRRPTDLRPDPIEIGVDYPEDFLVQVHLTAPTTVTLYVRPRIPTEVRLALAATIRESAYGLTGRALPVTPPDAETVVLGPDRMGRQIPLRELMKPLYAFMMLMMETFALGALIAEEVSTRTVVAVLATPATVADFLAAKVIVGTALAFSEASLIMLLVRGFADRPTQLVAALLLGALLVTGVSLVVGASGRDFLGLIFLSMAFLIPLAVPAVVELFPGTASPWVKAMPSYGLVQAVVGASSYGASWSDVLPHLAGTAAWCLLALASGLVVLRRKVALL